MLKALADLPVDLGIEAVEKFAMASLDSVRSKTGFMVSLLFFLSFFREAGLSSGFEASCRSVPQHALGFADGHH